MLDLYNRIAIVKDLAPAGFKTAAATTGINANSYEGGASGAVAVLSTGAYTDGTITPVLQDSPDNVTFTNVAAPFLQGAFVAIAGTGQQNAVQKVGYLGINPYLRVNFAVAGSPATGCILGLSWVLGFPHNAPTGSPN